MRRYSDKKINKHYIYLDSDRVPILLPCLFARYTEVVGKKIDLIKRKNRNSDLIENVFEEVFIGADASYKICNHLGRFLEWVDKFEGEGNITLSIHTALPQELINDYINEYLITECRSSEAVANQAVNSLKAYYNWLQYFLDNKYKNIGIKSSHISIARSNSKPSLSVKYLLPQTRELIYQSANSLLEEIILRNGGELGCRSKENQGFLLKDFNESTQKHKGLLSLFKELKKQPHKEEFKYYLSSLYTKYSRSRFLYIPRYLLEKMEQYFRLERPLTDSNHLFVSNSTNLTSGRCISTKFGTDTFAKTRNKVINEIQNNPDIYRSYQDIEFTNVYHHLRHSFGTDIFYNLCEGANKHYESITTTSAIYLTTANRLGHKVDGQFSNSVTKSYIHSCGLKEQLLKECSFG
ncbi:site-specific integrase [Pseudoalteromonas sp. Scap03]|uniref:site-specific integrase n=1 Tax=unclassified Pseudoalteromonas TaxID=194690 RepID=UPI0015B8A733|nr:MULTISPECIES: site-specific integrase [unclassified Pseudoalteromonas]NWL15500.1 site-specific integrase [Pseudoalteromonas sp. Scap03]QLE80647.1 site-specific integrase [Pseudoalteromonas sp. Scap25]QLE88590.1 site-specific integrase [Pseudoalteromonas sp. Scap06]